MLYGYVLENLWKTEFLMRKYPSCIGYFSFFWGTKSGFHMGSHAFRIEETITCVF